MQANQDKDLYVLLGEEDRRCFERLDQARAWTAPSHGAIARRAYERFLVRGRSHGHDVEDWLAAERELRGA